MTVPLTSPKDAIARAAYREQEGLNRHPVPRKGLTSAWYTLIAARPVVARGPPVSSLYMQGLVPLVAAGKGSQVSQAGSAHVNAGASMIMASGRIVRRFIRLWVSGRKQE
jgi:hypothetical protein